VSPAAGSGRFSFKLLPPLLDSLRLSRWLLVRLLLLLLFLLLLRFLFLFLFLLLRVGDLL
jgi:hypothetical protein